MTRLILCACLLVLTSCGVLQKLAKPKPKKPTAEKEHADMVIGTIEQVNPDQRYVLIHAGAHLMLAAGTSLYSTGAGGVVTKLKVTGERKGAFLAADIVAGNPQRKDNVMFHPTSTDADALGKEQPVPGGVENIPTTTGAPAPFPFPVPNQESVPAPASTTSPRLPSPSQPVAPSEFLRPVAPTPVVPGNPQ